jgi:hypothetical protein
MGNWVKAEDHGPTTGRLGSDLFSGVFNGHNFFVSSQSIQYKPMPKSSLPVLNLSKVSCPAPREIPFTERFSFDHAGKASR